MKSFLSNPAFALFAVVIFNLPFPIAEASDSAKVARLFHKLESLPLKATPYNTVSRLVRNLVEFDPLRTVKYYKYGISRVPDSLSPEIQKMTFKVYKIVKRSDLTQKQKVRIFRAVTPSES